MHCWLADSNHHDEKKVNSTWQTLHLFFSTHETIFCFHRLRFTHGEISSDCTAAKVRPERAGNKSKVFFIRITKMPVNFTYGLAFHFAGCSAEIKQKGKSTQKGFQFKPVLPSVCSSTSADCQRQHVSLPPPVLQLISLEDTKGSSLCW